MKREGQFLYRTTKEKTKHIKIKDSKDSENVNEILDSLIDSYLENNSNK